MTRAYVLVDRESWRPFFTLVFFAGLALVLSVPGVRTVGNLAGASLLVRTPTFFYTLALFMGLLGLGIGATSAERGERGAGMVRCLLLRVLLGEWLVLPYLVFSRALFPGREGAFALVILYTTLVSLLCAIVSRLVEQPLRWRSSTGFLVKYVLFLSYNVVPLAGIPFLSPLGATRLLLEGATPAATAAAFAVPCALLGVLVPFALHVGGKERV